MDETTLTANIISGLFHFGRTKVLLDTGEEIFISEDPKDPAWPRSGGYLVLFPTDAPDCEQSLGRAGSVQVAAEQVWAYVQERGVGVTGFEDVGSRLV